MLNLFHRECGDGSGLEKNSDDDRNRSGDLCRYEISAAAGDSFFVGVVSCIHGTFAGKMVGEKIAYQKRNCRWDFDWSYSVCVSLGDLEIIRHGDFPGGKSYDKYWSMGKTCGQIFKFMLSYD